MTCCLCPAPATLRLMYPFKRDCCEACKPKLEAVSRMLGCRPFFAIKVDDAQEDD